MNFQYYILFAFLTLVISTTSVFAQKERKEIRKGNEYYEKALGDSGYVDTIRMQNAELHYRKALDKDINSFAGGFNLGNSLFKQQKFSESADQYKILTTSENDNDKLAKVYHNLGNSLLLDGKLEESIEAYKSSLRINPTDTATKYNLAAAQKLLNDPQEQQEQDQCDNNEEQQDQDKKQKQEQEQKQEQDQEKQEQEQQEQQQAQEDEEKKDGEEKEAMKPDEISKEDAERLLKAIQQDEKELQEKLQKEKAKAKKIRVEKEW